ncbi:MAG TPA: DUF6152 family protein [Gammaproteobacteria bacterium]|nr:DUF6152 family protein [Gammaproteobacteria bacterium]
MSRSSNRLLALAGLAAVGALAAAAPAGAHHSFASYDRTKQVTLNGVVKDFQWANPHAWIQVVVSDAQGHSTQWGVECGSPNMMARTGWKRTLLMPGDSVVVVLNPLLDGRPNGSLVRVTLADGTVLGPGDAPKPRPLPTEK